MFTLDLRRLERGPVEIRDPIPADDSVWGEAGPNLLEPVACEVTAEGSRTRGVRVHGSLGGRVERECRRCLVPVELVVSDEIDLLFDPKTSKIEEDLGVYALDAAAEELELKRPLREQFVLAIPGYPLCRPDCRGLCPICGTNLNEAQCDCAPAGTDPRWGPLAALRKAT